jgi:hypothetical protein
MHMPKPGFLLLFIFLLLGSLWITPIGPSNSAAKKENAAAVPGEILLKKLKQKSAEAKNFTRQQSFNEEFCFLIDMSLPSGQNRFFIYDLVKDTIKSSGVVTHGRCNQPWLEGRKYSNEPGSGCTSLGKYKTGYSYNGQFGLAYKLYGLDKTNSNAFKRFVVLHAHECVPEDKTEADICQSDGCPTVSPGFLQQLKPLIDKSSKAVLLWIYE